MSERHFPITSEFGRRRGYVVCCNVCQAKEVIHAVNTSGTLPSSVIQKKLHQKGWRIGKNADKDTCSVCCLKELKPKITKKEDAAMSQADKVAVVVADPPRDMQREDRRIIFEKLNEVYADEKVGYLDNWNDDKLSKNLGVPRAWISKIRDENFGPEFDKQALKEMLSDGHALLAEHKNHLNECKKIIGEITEVARLGRALLATGAIQAEKIEAMCANVKTRLEVR